MARKVTEPGAELTDSDKVRLECESLRLEIDRLVTRDRLEREQLERTVGELKRAPTRNLVLGLLTIVATTATSIGVAFLAFSVSQSGSEQHEREVYQQLVAGLEQPNASVRIGAVTALNDYVSHPKCGWFTRCHDRAEQTFAMLTGRVIAEKDPFVLGALVQTLANSDVDSAAAISEIGAVNDQAQSNFLHSLQVLFPRGGLVKDRAQVLNSMNDEILDAVNLLAVPDKQGADAYNALFVLEDSLLSGARLHQFVSSTKKREGTPAETVRIAALQAAAASLATSAFIERVPLYLTGGYLSDTLVAGGTLDNLHLIGLQGDGATIQGSARQADLSCANFQGANFEDLDLRRTKVEGTDFTGALLPDNLRFKGAAGTPVMPVLHGSNWYQSVTANTIGTFFHKKLLSKRGDGTIANDRHAFESARAWCRTQTRVSPGATVKN